MQAWSYPYDEPAGSEMKKDQAGEHTNALPKAMHCARVHLVFPGADSQVGLVRLPAFDCYFAALWIEATPIQLRRIYPNFASICNATAGEGATVRAVALALEQTRFSRSQSAI